MQLKLILQAVATPNTAAEKSLIRIVTLSDQRVLYQGPADETPKELSEKGWLVVEITRNTYWNDGVKETSMLNLPIHNRPYNIVVT